MSWITPKTDWVGTDYFNATDYNRVKGNLNELKAISLQLYQDYITSDLGADKDFTSLLYAEEINNIENFLESININTFPLAIGEKQVYVSNGKTMDFNELNRIESAILLLYNTFRVQKQNLQHLSFRLGTERGIKP